ncbi:uncharacterized protein F5Z01DRAFT_369848 [Emericellopsis atlantica]|uniref:Uncharacterized protein n=1 Tax=Emericellopsis atlantica TaxID=2614577 RepID=A0A9P8CKL9_9HYPO|nr:uncharacterized protein F5Z01DRAFT_369848 [Emericellopsis atlantica]KAG9250498.1 hypothetical protein F5Z01DRAFT_369848 [Emericellopsis atlantica]
MHIRSSRQCCGTALPRTHRQPQGASHQRQACLTGGPFCVPPRRCCASVGLILVLQRGKGCKICQPRRFLTCFSWLPLLPRSPCVFGSVIGGRQAPHAQSCKEGGDCGEVGCPPSELQLRKRVRQNHPLLNWRCRIAPASNGSPSFTWIVSGLVERARHAGAIKIIQTDTVCQATQRHPASRAVKPCWSVLLVRAKELPMPFRTREPASRMRTLRRTAARPATPLHQHAFCLVIVLSCYQDLQGGARAGRVSEPTRMMGRR